VSDMRTNIDKSGRFVIPHALRSRIGLADGGSVDVHVQGAAIIIEPVGGDDLQHEDGLIVIPATSTAIDDALVQELRRGDQR